LLPPSISSPSTPPAGTWQEQRDWGLTFPVAALADHPLAQDILQAWRALSPQPPSSTGYAPVEDPSKPIVVADITLAFDKTTGALNRLDDAKRGISWLDSGHMLGTFEYKVRCAFICHRESEGYMVHTAFSLTFTGLHLGAQHWRVRRLFQRIRSTHRRQNSQLLPNGSLLDCLHHVYTTAPTYGSFKFERKLIYRIHNAGLWQARAVQ
jgi:hypothetical protein